MANSKLPPEQEALRLSCWKNRVRIDYAAQACGCTVKALHHWLSLRGLTHSQDGGFARKTKVTPEMAERIIDLRCEGLSFCDIAKRTGIGKSTVAIALRKRGYR